MISVEYRPYYLESYQKVDERYLILIITPIYYEVQSDDLIHQIHIRTTADLSASGLFGSYGFDRYINEEVPIFICEENEIKGILSIFEGFYESESEISFGIAYISIEHKIIEKTASDWKKEFLELSRKHDDLIKFKAKDSQIVRQHLNSEYKELFDGRIEFLKANFMDNKRKCLQMFEESIFKHVINTVQNFDPSFRLITHVFKNQKKDN